MDNHNVSAFKEERNIFFPLDSIPIPCMILDGSYSIIEINDEALKYFGSTSKDSYCNNFINYYSAYYSNKEEANKRGTKLIEEAFENGRSKSEWTFVSEDGSLLFTVVILTRIFYNNSLAVAIYLTDISELNKKLSEINDANERAQIMLESTPLCTNFLDEEGNVVDCNQEALDLFGINDKGDYLRRFYELSPEFQPDGRPSKEKAFDCFKRAFQTGHYVFEWMHQTLSGESLPTEVTLVRVKGNSKYVAVGFARDLREIKNTMSKLKQFELLAFTDNLTGIYNRRFFWDSAAQILSDYSNSKRIFSVIIFDCDYFKNVNDVYGHAMGDEVLKAVAIRVKKALRPTDVFSRYGGDEFAVLLADTRWQEAEKVACRLRDTVGSTCYSLMGKEIRQTISLGVSENNNGSPLEVTMDMADEALYRAKQKGRNRAEVFVF